MKRRFIPAVLGSFFIASCLVSATAQTFEIGNQPEPTPESQRGGRRRAQAPAPSQETGIGWGSSIEVGRLARASEDALKRGDMNGAANFAERAVKAAPQNARLWLLLGYTSRMAARYQQSIDAYQRVLRLEPGSADALSGLAQTYMRMNRNDDAKRLLAQVLAANPRRQNDLLIAGELYMKTGDTQTGINYLERADRIKPSAHAELLMAIAYMKLKQPQKAKQLLDMARKRAPNNVQIFQAAATYYREQRDYASAIQTLKSAPRTTPGLLADLAYTYELSGDKENSAASYVKAADAAPKEIKYQLSAAHGLIASGQTERAKTFLTRAEQIDPNHYRLHAIRGGLARSQNRNDEAIREYTLAINALPEGVPEGQLYPVLLRLNLSQSYRDAGNDAAARQQLALAEEQINRITVEGPARAEFLRVRASIATSEKNYAAAEEDLKQAQQLDPGNTAITLQYANLLWRAGRPSDSRKVYLGILDKDAKNRFALEALGYLSRESGDIKEAESYFNRLASTHPDDYVAYLALGDLYTATHDFSRADANYEKANKLAPKNAVVIANAANAAIEARQIPLAGRWIERAEGATGDDPRVMRERERYLFHTGNYKESARLGYQVLEKLPKDRNASVYLAYALYNLGRFDDVLAVSAKYESILPKEANFPLLQGHIHRQSQLLNEATADYTRALQRDPRMVEAYVNRGYVLNDLQNAEQAAQDFQTALQLRPENGTAHLGLAFSELQLRHGSNALRHVNEAEKLMGESGAIHLARATAYRQQRLLASAEKEYQTALKFTPNDLRLRLALADTQYRARKYQQSIATLSDALTLAPGDPLIYSHLAHAHAELRHRDETLRYVQLAEQLGSDRSAVLLDTGDALLSLGDRDAAMQRFERALDAPDANRVRARLAIARLMVRDGQPADARQQVSLAFAESRIGEASPVDADDLVEAANIFLAMNDFDLAQRYFAKAKEAGAADEVTAIGLANTSLARGDHRAAQEQLTLVGDPVSQAQNYDYQLALGAMYRQQHDRIRALSAFARANNLGGTGNDAAERALEDVAGEVGLRVNDRVSVLSDFDMHATFEDTTTYMLDRSIFNVTDPALLPTPRSSLETLWTNAYRVHIDRVPLITGFFQVRNARGQVSLPSEALILNRNTYDYTLNGGVNPVLHLGRLTLTFNTGLQFTFRRDSRSPIQMNQNLFRQFVYMSTNSIGNWLQVRAQGFHESGPFTDRDVSSRDVGGRLEFAVGRPWGKTSLLTGYSVRDLQFSPLFREFFTTTTYVGLERRFSRKFTAAAVGEYVRSWRVQNAQFAIAQAMQPGGRISYEPNNRWRADASISWGRGQGFHDYDNVQSSFFISYVKPIRRSMTDALGEVPVEYPLRFSFGVQTDNFYNFPGRGQAQIRPVVRLTLF